MTKQQQISVDYVPEFPSFDKSVEQKESPAKAEPSGKTKQMSTKYNTNSSFNPNEYLMDIKGKKYLPVAARIAWMRTEHPNWRINTDIIEWNKEKKWVVARATVYTHEGIPLSTAIKSESSAGFSDYLEKAETGAIGRALAMCGYGTLQAPEFDEGVDRIVDAPQGR